MQRLRIGPKVGLDLELERTALLVLDHGDFKAVRYQPRLEPAQALRQAMIAALENKPDGETNRLLDISYSVAPLDPEIFKYRTRFVLENWDRMSPTVRDDARAEMTVGWHNYLERDALQGMAPVIANPSGRTALALQIQLMEGPGLPALKPAR